MRKAVLSAAFALMALPAQPALATPTTARDPVTITVSYAGQDGTPKPFLVVIDGIKVGQDGKIASEILLPVPPGPDVKQ